MDREQLHRARRSVSIWGPFGSGFTIFIVCAALGVASLFAIDAWAPRGMQPALIVQTSKTVMPIFMPAIILVVWLVPKLFMMRAWSRERARVAALPFRVEQYEELVAEGPWIQDDELHFALEFAGSAPAEARLREILAADGAAWTIEWDDAVAHLTRDPGFRDKRVETNRALVRWFHRFLDGAAAALHREAPLARIAFERRNRRPWRKRS